MKSRAVFSTIAVLAFLTAAPVAQAAEISVVTPANKGTIFSNQGKLTVKLSRVDAPPGARVRLVLDGAARPKTYRGNVIELKGIYRGNHSLQAILLSADGRRVAVSAPVTFYMWHASRLFPNRK
ncbi:MAG: hypothetical protein ACREUK_07840 [Burkholderiales bacterium]